MKNEIMKVFNAYSEALSRGDFEGAFETMSDEILWHMGGEGPLSGTVAGKQKLAECFGEYSERSGGTFKVITDWAAPNSHFVAVSVVSMAEKDGNTLNNPGIDLFRIENGKIQEVWTFSKYQSAEDEFWKK